MYSKTLFIVFIGCYCSLMIQDAHCIRKLIKKVVLKSMQNDPHPVPWIQIKGLPNLYYFSKVPRTWIQAFRFCATENGTLLTIQSKLQKRLVSDHIHNISNPKALWWTSGSNIYTRDKAWIWMSTGKPFTYTNWCKGEPNNRRGNEYCMCMNTGSNCWRDVPCDINGWHRKHFYAICEKPNLTTYKSTEPNNGPLTIHFDEPISKASEFWSPCIWFVRYVKLSPQWQVRCTSPVEITKRG